MRIPRRRSKYAAKRTVVDGITFASKREAKRYGELKIMAQAGVIRNLELQPKFDLHAPNGEKVGRYIADFRYYDTERGRTVVEDVKGVRTTIYKRSKKHVEAEYGITVVEV